MINIKKYEYNFKADERGLIKTYIILKPIFIPPSQSQG